MKYKHNQDKKMFKKKQAYVKCWIKDKSESYYWACATHIIVKNEDNSWFLPSSIFQVL